METIERDARMWADLLTSENAARAAQHEVTNRAQLYLASGLPLERILEALKISRATWYRRLSELAAWEARNSKASRDVMARLDAARALDGETAVDVDSIRAAAVTAAAAGIAEAEDA
ncbi:MAG: hypothetical protein QOE72_4832 [Chloroflexota bacterium]|jgi:hypothetical protein|nr:hypothetical protein [Thermoleophilaceae bacterium]MEA2619049.1 hypothetical protein [Chloroflexota bacterium]